MASKLVIDRLWLQDYIYRVKQEITEVEYICDDLRIAESMADPADLILYEQTILDFEKLREELVFIADVLEQFLGGMDEAKQILDIFVSEMRDTLNL